MKKFKFKKIDAFATDKSRLIVHPDHQNRGIGKKLMQAIENKFSGSLRYELFTGYKSEKNLALYRKLGYRKYKEKAQSDNVLLVCMEKRRAWYRRLHVAFRLLFP